MRRRNSKTNGSYIWKEGREDVELFISSIKKILKSFQSKAAYYNYLFHGGIMKNWIFFLIFISIFIIGGCAPDSDDNDNNLLLLYWANLTAADMEAIQGFEKLSELVRDTYNHIKTIDENDNWNSVDSGDDLCNQTRFIEVKQCFEESLNLDAGNARGNFGMAIVRLAELNFDADIWGNLVKKIIDKNYDITPETVDAMIDNKVKSRLQEIISYIDFTITHLGQGKISIKDNNNEEYLMGTAEAYILRAAAYVLLAAVKIIQAYDLHIADEEGSYKWIENEKTDFEYWKLPDELGLPKHAFLDLPDTTNPYWSNRSYLGLWNIGTVDGTSLTLELTDISDVQEKDFKISISNLVKYNLERETFLKLKASHELPGALDDIRKAVDDIEASYNFILASPGDQSMNMIKKKNIEDSDEEISNYFIEHSDSVNIPDIAKNWRSVGEIISWAKNALTNKKETFEIRGEYVTVDISPIFNGDLNDLELYLPYYEWKESTDWAVLEDKTLPLPHSSTVTCVWGIIDDDLNITASPFEEADIDSITRNWHSYTVMPIDLIDSPGGVPINEDDIAVFPDYTFGGTTSNMNKTKFENIFNK